MKISYYKYIHYNIYIGELYCLNKMPQKGDVYMNEKAKINNAALLPLYCADDAVALEDGTPDWVKHLVIEEIHIRCLTEEGTIAAAEEKLPYFAQLGVNGLWVTPVNDRGPVGNGYGNLGPDTIDPRLTGALSYDEDWRLCDYEKGWAVFRHFVERAHQLNIRILLDIVTWGAEGGCPLFESHPDWFVPGIKGMITDQSRFFEWRNDEFVEWFIQRAVEMVELSNVDGLRFDMEPMYASYAVCKEIRRRLYATGRKPVIISESPNERMDTFDFEQFGVLDRDYVCTKPQQLFLTNNILDCIRTGHGVGSTHVQWAHKGGIFRYYTHQVCSHDYHSLNVFGNPLVIGYQAIFAPFIPLWFVGEEWNNPDITVPEGCTYYNKIRWDLLEQEPYRTFNEEVKRMLCIRRSYPAIFSYFPAHTMDANICGVDTDATDNLQAYARYAEGKAVLIIPNNKENLPVAHFTVTVPFEAAGLQADRFRVTDLLTDTVVAQGTREEITHLPAQVPYQHMAVYLVEPCYPA